MHWSLQNKFSFSVAWFLSKNYKNDQVQVVNLPKTNVQKCQMTRLIIVFFRRRRRSEMNSKRFERFQIEDFGIFLWWLRFLDMNYLFDCWEDSITFKASSPYIFVTKTPRKILFVGRIVSKETSPNLRFCFEYLQAVFHWWWDLDELSKNSSKLLGLSFSFCYGQPKFCSWAASKNCEKPCNRFNEIISFYNEYQQNTKKLKIGKAGLDSCMSESSR